MPNYAKHLLDLNSTNADKIALVDQSKKLTFGELSGYAFGYANYLRSQDIKSRDRVILFFDNCVEWPVAFLSLLLIGANPVLVSHNVDRDQLNYVADLVDAAAVITDQNLDINLRCLDINAIMLSQTNQIDVYDYHGDEPCVWLLTSGTTGRPKAIVHRHDNLVNYSVSRRPSFGITKDSKLYTTSKLSFGYAFHVMMTVSLPVGATVYMTSGLPNPTKIYNFLNEHNITHFATVPVVIHSMLKHRKNKSLPASLQLVFSSAENLPVVVSRDFYDCFGIKILNLFGAAENSMGFLIQNFQNYEHGTLGLPMPDVECKLLDANGVEVPPGDIGELYVKTNTTAMGYWKNHDKTVDSFLGRWFRSGDLMRITQQGNYVYVSRLDDQVKINGQFVSAIEIEDKLLSLGEIQDCAVVFKNTELFHEVHAFIVLNPDYADLDFDSIKTKLSASLPQFKIPRYFHGIAEIPKTVTNKTKRSELKNLLK